MSDLVIVVFAAWYVAYTVTSTHGPGGVFDWIREHVWHGRGGLEAMKIRYGFKRVETPPEPAHDGLLDCPVCLAFWAALVLLIAPMGIVTQALAVAGAAMILHGWSGWRFAQ